MNHKKLVREILLEMKSNRKLRLYAFDWDDNILQMPTKIKMDQKVGKRWKPIEVSTEKFAEIRTEPDYRVRNNNPKEAFIDFTLPDTFLRDSKEAILKNKKSPSFNKFKESLIYANPFSIITARGHNPEVLKKGVKMFIHLVLSPEEKEKMLENIIDTLKHENEFSDDFIEKLEYLDKNQILDLYLDEKGDYYPVSSPEFGERFGLEVSGGAANPEHNKKVALADFISKYDDLIRSGKYVSASLGFSDDDPRNVKAMIEFVRNELSRMYPEVKFIIQDTSEGGYTKIHIETDNKEEELNEGIIIENLINRIVSKIKSK
jgi:hypothetical protein